MLAAEQMSLLLLRGARLFTFWGIGLTVAIWLFSDDDLEAWCDQSCLRKNRSNKGFDSPEAEMAALSDAVKGVS